MPLPGGQMTSSKRLPTVNPCAQAVVYEPLGSLVPPPKLPRTPRQHKSPKELKAARVNQVERETKRLCAELKALTAKKGN